MINRTQIVWLDDWMESVLNYWLESWSFLFLTDKTTLKFKLNIILISTTSFRIYLVNSWELWEESFSENSYLFAYIYIAFDYSINE